MASNVTYSLELKEGQYSLLTRMAKKYDLPDEGKALRCLLNFALERPDLEKEIFEEIRCFDC